MQHFIKAISFSLGLFLCASPIMAQFPKIPKVPKVPKVSNKIGNNSAENRKEYERLMTEGRVLKNAAKYSEAIPLFDKAASNAPTQSEYSTQTDDSFEQDARKEILACNKAIENCKALRKKIDEQAAAKLYENALSTLHVFCEIKEVGCECLMPKTEIAKIEADLKKGIANEEKALVDYHEAEKEKELAAKFALVPDDGVSGTLHKANVNKIVFSKTAINGNSPASAISNTFTLGDDIYFRVFMEQSVGNQARKARKEFKNLGLSARFFINDKLMTANPNNQGYDMASGSYSISTERYENFDTDKSTTAIAALARNWGAIPSDQPPYSYNKLLLDFFYTTYQLPVGTHKVKILCYGDVISGEFTLNVTEAGKLALGKKLCGMPLIKDQYAGYNTALRIVPTATEMVKKNMPENTTLIKVIEGQDWSYTKNAFGIITHRNLWGKAFLKDNATGLYFVKDIDFRQENISSGGSKYGATTWSWNNLTSSGYRFCKECLGK